MDIQASLLISVIMGLAQVTKKLGISPKLIPVQNVGVGVFLSWLYSLSNDMPWNEWLILGFVLGLSASGLFSSYKNVIDGIRK